MLPAPSFEQFCSLTQRLPTKGDPTIACLRETLLDLDLDDWSQLSQSSHHITSRGNTSKAQRVFDIVSDLLAATAANERVSSVYSSTLTS